MRSRELYTRDVSVFLDSRADDKNHGTLELCGRKTWRTQTTCEHVSTCEFEDLTILNNCGKVKECKNTQLAPEKSNAEDCDNVDARLLPSESSSD